MSLRRNGTPRNGPLGKSGETAAFRASSNSGVITALSVGLSRSMRAIAASTNSRGVSSRRRTSSACAVASIVESSSMFSPMLFAPCPTWVDSAGVPKSRTAFRQHLAERLRLPAQLVEQHLGVLEVGGVEALGKPLVDVGPKGCDRG